MKKIILKFVFCVLISSVAGISQAYAHALWIEKGSDGKLNVCYGEYGEGLREKSGDKLDTIGHLEAWSVDLDGKRTEIKTGKDSDRFVLETALSPVFVQEAGMPVKDMKKYKMGMAKSYLYARYQGGAGAFSPQLRLDAVEDVPGQVLVTFDGKPLAGEKASWIAPNGWMKELKTDDQGHLKIGMPWAGLYVLEVTHVLEDPGQFEGEAYETERHRMSLSLEKK